MTLGQLLRSTEQRLASAGIDDARLEAELLWMTALRVERAVLYVQMNDGPPKTAAANAEALITRRLRREPIAYLMGHREFFGLEFLLTPGVLIPRPETETLVTEALRLLKHRGEEPLTVADVGCGAGIIGISLAVTMPNLSIYAIDVADQPRRVTAHNARILGVEAQISILDGDLLAPLPAAVDLIVANLPYVPSEQVSQLEPEISIYEPREALDGGHEGLELIHRLLADAPNAVKPNGSVLLEIAPHQTHAASAAARKSFSAARISVLSDLAGCERVLVIETESVSQSASD